MLGLDADQIKANIVFALDSSGKKWEVVSDTRHSRYNGQVTRWIARRECLDGEGNAKVETINNESGRVKRFHSEAACEAAVTGKRARQTVKQNTEALW